MMAFLFGVILGTIITVGMIAMLSGDSYDDGYRQAMKDYEERKRHETN